MKGNGDIKKYFDALNKRFDALTEEVGDIKLKVDSLNILTTDMLRVQQIIIKDIADLKIRVERLEGGQKRIIVLLTKLGKRVSDFDSGEKLELAEVHYDESSHTLTATIRENKTQYRVRKRKQKR